MTFRKTLLAAGIGILSGLASTLFLYLLDFATRLRLGYPPLIWALPLAGFAIGWVYLRLGRAVAGGHGLILDEIHEPKKVVPFIMAPLILLSTVLTHLCGGSAGREGTAVQMGASLADQLSRFFKMDVHDRRFLLMAGAGAGFGSAVGAPWAGTIFGMEVIQVGELRIQAFWESLIASFLAYATTLLLQAPHSVYPFVTVPGFQVPTLLLVALAGVAFGLTARIFAWLAHALEDFWRKRSLYAPFKTALAGLLLAILLTWEGTQRYAGLGIAVIQDALQAPAFWHDPALKTFFTVLTVGSGFKGGEFIPLVYIGTTLGSVLGPILSVDAPLLAAVGFAAVFAGAANTPLACSLMAMEIFGWSFAPYALIGCYMSYLVSGHKGIYKGQKILRKKHEFYRLR